MTVRSTAVAVLLVAGSAAAQAPYELQRGQRFLAATFGGSFPTGAGPRFGVVRNRAVVMGSAQAEWVLAAGRYAALSGLVEIPVALVLPSADAPGHECWWRLTTRLRLCSLVDRPHDAVMALGVSPLGLKVSASPASQARFFAALSGGGMYFDRNTPVVAARALNFSSELSVGIDVSSRDGSRVASLGWKYQHWSNAGTAPVNPGLDANLIVVAVRSRR